MEIILPSPSVYREMLDPNATLPWLRLEPEERQYNKTQYGAYTEYGARICELRLNDASPYRVDSPYVSWVKRLDAADPNRPKGVGLATHLLLVESLEPQGKTLVSDPWFMTEQGINL